MQFILIVICALLVVLLEDSCRTGLCRLCVGRKCKKGSDSSPNFCHAINEMCGGVEGTKKKTFSAIFVERKLNCEEALPHEF